MSKSTSVLEIPLESYPGGTTQSNNKYLTVFNKVIDTRCVPMMVLGKIKSRLSPSPLSFGNRPTTPTVCTERTSPEAERYMYRHRRCEDAREPFLSVPVSNVSTDGKLMATGGSYAI